MGLEYYEVISVTNNIAIIVVGGVKGGPLAARSYIVSFSVSERKIKTMVIIPLR